MRSVNTITPVDPSELFVYEVTARKVDDPNHVVWLRHMPATEADARRLVEVAHEQCPDLTGYVIWEKRISDAGTKETCIYREVA